MRAHRKAAILAGLLAIVAVTALAPAAGAAQKGADCGDMPRYYTESIRATKVECGKAKQVVLRYIRVTVKNLQHDWSVTVLGFNCDMVKKEYDGNSFRCTAGGGQEITWRRGTR